MDYKQRVDELIPQIQGMYNRWIGDKPILSGNIGDNTEPMVIGAGERRMFIRGNFDTTEDLGKLLTKISESQKSKFPEVLESVTSGMKDTKGDPTLSHQFETIVDLQSTPVPHFTKKESEILTAFTVAHELAHYYYSGKTTNYSEAMGQMTVAQSPNGMVRKTLDSQVNELQADVMAVKMLNHLYPKNHPDHHTMEATFDKIKDMRLIGSVSSVAQMSQYNFYDLYKDNGKLIKEISKLNPEEIYKRTEDVGLNNLKKYGALVPSQFWETNPTHREIIQENAIQYNESLYLGREDTKKMVNESLGLDVKDKDLDVQFKRDMTFTEKDKKYLEDIPAVVKSGDLINGVLYRGDRVAKLESNKEWFDDTEDKKDTEVKNENTVNLKP
jgi:hypothetical protein